jgi:uncharacterized Zn-binding protein involved in type VI secretion
MPAVARAGVDSIATGHACAGTAGITTSGAATNVYINGSRAALLGTLIATHTIKAGNACVPHGATVTGGSSKVFCGGIPLARIGDSADLGAIKTASSNVFAG